MPILKGDVEILGLGNLLQLLAMNHREGVLTLARDGEEATVFDLTREGVTNLRR